MAMAVTDTVDYCSFLNAVFLTKIWQICHWVLVQWRV